MSDLIDRQAAIDLIKSWSGGYEYIETPTGTAVRLFEQLPSAQSTQKNESNTLDALDCVSRQAAIDCVNRAVTQEMARWAIKELPSAQPEIIRCKDCLMHSVCRFETGLGLDGYCSQAERREEDG